MRVRANSLILLMGVLLMLVGTGCSEDDCLGSDQTINEYIADNLSTLGDTTVLNRLVYIIDVPGEADRPEATSEVTVRYTGVTTEGETFDETGDVALTFPLDELIPAWRIGIPLIGRGGRIRMFVEPRLAYGANQAANLCASTALIFDVELVDFQ
ncbi:MAG: FKBP-type peptidyl-prolyl cis-trans isomerase [Lewinella sp.]